MGPNPITPIVLRTTYIAVTLQDILYGAELVLYFETLHAVLTLEKKRRPDVLHMLFSTIMFILVTILVVVNSIFGEDVSMDHSNYPGGAGAYWSSTSRLWYLSFGRGAFFVLQLMTDALLIHRCRIIWQNTLVITVPLILWFIALVIGVFQSWLFDSIVTTFLPRFATEVALVYYVVCVGLNITLSSLICYRIICHGRLIHAELGHEHSTVYFAIAEIVVESALPFTLSGIAFLVSLGVRSYAVTPLSWVYFMMTCISPQMLILWIQKRRKLGEGMAESSSGSQFAFRHFSAGPVQEGNDPERTMHL